jgi:hypothetical protein
VLFTGHRYDTETGLYYAKAMIPSTSEAAPLPRRGRTRRQRATAGEIWTFPLGDGRNRGYLRVVLGLQDLSLPKANAMAFVADTYLVQISGERALGDGMFDPPRLLVDGTFLAPDDPWSDSGYERVGFDPVNVECVEFPCWFDNVSAGGGRTRVVFCRGEFQKDAQGVDRDGVEESWGQCYLERRYPAQLSSDFEPGPRLTERFRRSDIRYHPRRGEILARTGVDIAGSYMDLVRGNPGRLEVYRRAVSAEGRSPKR